MLNFLWYIIVGFFAGWIARAVLPGADHMGFIATTVVGIVGGLIGGYLGGRFSKADPNAKFQTAGFIWSVIGAIVLLVLLRLVK